MQSTFITQHIYSSQPLFLAQCVPATPGFGAASLTSLGFQPTSSFCFLCLFLVSPQPALSQTSLRYHLSGQLFSGTILCISLPPFPVTSVPKMVLFLHLLNGLPFVSQVVWRSTGISRVFFAVANIQNMPSV